MRKSVRPMVGTCYMNESEMEHENGDYPAIDTSTGGNIGIHEHAFDITGIDFDDQVSDAYEIEPKCTKCTVKPIEFELSL